MGGFAIQGGSSGPLSFGDSSQITHNQTSTSTTFIDVIGASITLPNAGTYELEYSIPCNNNTVGSGVIMAITTSANAIVSGSTYVMSEAQGGGVTGNCIGKAIQVVAAPTTYKVRWRVAGGTGAIGNDETPSTIWGSARFTYKQIA